MNITAKVYQETQHFIEKVESHGFDPISAFYAMFPRIMKEVEHETIQLAELSLEHIQKFFQEHIHHGRKLKEETINFMDALVSLGYEKAFSTTLTHSLEQLHLELKNYKPIEKNTSFIAKRKFFL